MATKNFITFEHPRTGITREAPVGFNWQLLQFGALLPMHHREWKLCALVVVAGLATFSVSNVLLAFFYNKLRVRSLIRDGFLARGTEEGSITQMEARLGLRLPRHWCLDEPPGRDAVEAVSITPSMDRKTSIIQRPPQPEKPAQSIDSRGGTTISVMDHGTVQNRLLYPLPRHD